MEANLLRYLIEREGQVVSRKNILEDVWNLREDTDTRAIDHFIAREITRNYRRHPAALFDCSLNFFELCQSAGRQHHAAPGLGQR